ncbi:non-structural maintenance of chromosomes element 1 homolog isoform X2 [Cloeon dipterum]
MDYGDSHRRFLKCLMAANNVVAQNKTIEMYCQCRNGDDDKMPEDATLDVGIPKFIEQINQQIEPLNLSIKLVTCEATGEKFYVLYTAQENELTKLVAARQWGRNERMVLKTIVRSIVSSSHGKVTVATCARDCAELPDKIKRADVVKALETLLRENWLIEVDGHVYIGTRSMVELKKFLMDEFKEQAGICKLCIELALRGESCPSNCGVKVHQTCKKVYFSKSKKQVCMGCSKPWPDSDK